MNSPKTNPSILNVMCRDQFDPITMFSPSGSPRSSVSSATTNVCGAPLTPLYELDGAAGEMVVTESATVDDSEGEQDALLREHIAAGQASKRVVNLSLAVPPPPAFSTFAFPPQGGAAAAAASLGVVSPGDEGIALPREGFTFGTCPSAPFLGTPVVEQGPFEYPDMTGGRSTSRSSSIKGSSPQSRSNSRSPIFRARPLSISSQHSLHSQSDIPSPPATRRSSTVSDITTLPVAGRRPSIVHSATAETPVVADATSASSSNHHHPSTRSVTPLPTPGPLAHHGSIRRPSTLSFQQKALPQPIPPSLLARRGSLPAAHLFRLPLSELSAHRSRASASGIPTVPQSPAVSTASLYQRRQSIATETDAGGVGHARGGTLGEKMRTTSISAGSDSTGYTSAGRRGSVPSSSSSFAAASSRNTLLNRSGSTCSQTSRRSFTTLRTPTTPPVPCAFATPSPRIQPASLLPPLSVPSSPRSTRSSLAEGAHAQTRSGHSGSSDDDDEMLPTPAMDTLSISSGGGGAGLNRDVVCRGSSEDEVYLGVAAAASGGQMVVVESPTAMMRDEKTVCKPSPPPWPVQVIAPTPPIETETEMETPGLETVFERPPLESAESVDSGKTLT